MVEQNIGILDQCVPALSDDTVRCKVSADILLSDEDLPDWETISKDSTSDAASLIDFNQPTWLSKAKDDLKQLEQLKEDWDSYGSPPLSPELLKNAEDFLDSIEFENVPSPFIAPVHGGGVQFEWMNNDKELEVEFIDQSVIGYVKLINGKTTDEGEMSFNNRASARELIRWLDFNE
ncbi:MAG: hypothetical protein JW837_08650 [Sedimentisphaerales bacterium]|nr:hypothetical protein [Sedimentisphaerales bacterium]